MRGLYKVKLFYILLLCIFGFVLLSAPAHAAGGVGVTGSFSTYKYKIVQGETIDTPYVNVKFVNNYSYDVKLRISQETPDGVNIEIDEEVVEVEANSVLEIPIVISVAEDAIPGEYDIYVRAKLIKDIIEGQVNIGSSYALKTQLTVFGEAADLEIDVVDVAGEPIQAIMNLYHIDNGSMSPLTYSDRGTIIERVIPGEYEVFAFWNDFQLVRHKFSVVADQQYKKTLVAETVQIYAYTVSPVFVENIDYQLATADIRFTLHNIYKDLDNSRVVLSVYKNDELVEEKDIFIFDKLEVKRHELGLHYVPAQGWDMAEYKFVLEFYVDEHNDNGDIVNSTLYASSAPALLDVSSDSSFKSIFSKVLLVLFILAILLGLFFLIRYLLKKRGTATPEVSAKPIPKAITHNACPDCGGAGIVECPICKGTGKTLYESIEEDCIYCSSLGEVMCANCINTRHLIVCPKCNGDGQIDGSECTYCNGIGNIVATQYAKFKDGTKLKLGKKNK